MEGLLAFLFIVDWLSSQLSLLQMRQLGMIDENESVETERQKFKLLFSRVGMTKTTRTNSNNDEEDE